MQDIQTLTVKDNSEELRNALLKPMTTLRNCFLQALFGSSSMISILRF